MSYLHSITRAVDLIESRLASSVTIEEIAAEAGISRWHFQRVFRAMVGETVGDYVLRRRLTLAARELLTTQKTVLDIAIECGFESHEVFSRAFKRVFEVNPSAFRKQTAPRPVLPLKPRITLEYLSHLYGGVSLEPKLVEFAGLEIFGLSERIKPVNDHLPENQSVIRELWGRVRQLASGLDLTRRVAVLAMPSENDPEPSFEYFAGCPSRPCQGSSSALRAWRIPAGEYAVFMHRGAMSRIAETYHYIYGFWFAKSQRKRSEGPEFCLYPADFDPASETQSLEIFIPLSK